MKCPKCGHDAVFGAFGITELAYLYCANCGATFPKEMDLE